MTQRETLTEKHTRLARRMLDQADREIAEGDLPQASEKLWGAASHAIKAVCASRGWEHSKYAHRNHAVRSLGKEVDHSVIPQGFQAARSCHGNFYNDWMEPRDLEERRIRIRSMVEKVLAM